MHDFLNDVYGQGSAKTLLENLIKTGRIPHALLFCGSEGVGKHFTAIQFAKLLNSENINQPDSVIYKRISSLSEPYIKYVMPLPRGKGETAEDSSMDKLSKEVVEQINDELKIKTANPYHIISIDNANTIKINSIREIKKFISINYDDIKYRIIIINEAHLMNEESQNALLKSLEEPPEGIVFILLTPYKDRLLTTIQSRCWGVNFEPLTEKDIEEILTKYFDADKKTAGKVSHFAEGSITTAVELIDQDLDKTLENAISLLRYSLAKKYNSAFAGAKKLVDDSPETFIATVRIILKWLNDVIKNRVDVKSYYFNDYKDTIEKFNLRFGETDINSAYDKLSELINAYDRNVNLNVIILNVIFELSAIVNRN